MNAQQQLTITAPELDSLELEILASIPESGRLEERAYAVWISPNGPEAGRLELGPIRLRRTWQGSTLFSCSPFPGAWYDVPQENILRVSAPGALITNAAAAAILESHAEYLEKMRAPRSLPECPNPWHRTAPARARMICPECPEQLAKEKVRQAENKIADAARAWAHTRLTRTGSGSRDVLIAAVREYDMILGSL